MKKKESILFLFFIFLLCFFNCVVLAQDKSSSSVSSPSTIGTTAQPNQTITPPEWPFMAALKVNGEQICNGALINESFVITAARCVYFLSNWEISKLRAVVGFNNLSLSDSTLDLEIQSVIIHDAFRPRYSVNDVALLQLKKIVNITNYVTIDKLNYPANCSFDNHLYAKSNADAQVTVVGWSLFAKPADDVKKVQKLNLTLMLANVECSQFGGLHVGGEKPNTDGFMCGLNPPKPLYQELSTNNTLNGAPVVYRPNSNSSWLLIGIISGGLPEWCYWKSAWLYPSKCYRSYEPYGIYITSVPANRKWIANFQCEQ